jgi:hypothetical protein
MKSSSNRVMGHMYDRITLRRESRDDISPTEQYEGLS